MKNDQLQRVLRLLRRTGDRGIVLDAETSEVFVLMDADGYEELLDDAEIVDLPPLAPADGAVSEDEDDGEGDFVLDDLIDLQEAAVVTDQPVKTEQPVARSVKPDLEKLSFENAWPKTPERAVLKEESLTDVPEDEPGEEEKFYLEPVE